MHNTQSSAVSTNSENSTVAASYDSIRKDAEEYRSNLAIASKILANETSYTKVIFDITKLLPDGVTIDQLSLQAADFSKQTSFIAHAKSYDKATELKKNFQESSIFSNVYLESITDAVSSGATPNEYPVTVTLSAKLNGDKK
ncbi:MAG: PilN domain-containing protein [Candidatus Saccharimonadales bacterium]